MMENSCLDSCLQTEFVFVHFFEPERIVMSDEEDDYMSDKFLAGYVKLLWVFTSIYDISKAFRTFVPV